MIRITLGGISAAALLAVAMPVAAQDRAAIIIANRNYDTIRDVTEASRAFDLTRALREAGFEVTTFRDVDAEAMNSARSEIVEALDEGERVLVFVSGQIASTPRDSYLLATDAIRPTQLMPGADALSLGGIMDLLSGDAGAAVLLVGEAGAAFGARGEATPGFSEQAIPQGVTVFSGPTDALISLAEDQILREGVSYGTVADNLPRNVKAQGFISTHVGFLPVEGGQSETPSIPGVSEAELDLFFFSRAEASGTADALNDYLTRFPNGLYVSQARRLLADMQRSPVELAQEAEQALNLSRTERIEIQRNLTLLGYDTNGVDGILGRGSRAAITRWQGDTGQAATGYLDRDQIRALANAAADERQRVERLDAAFWRETGGRNTEAGYRAYLNRYPDGIFADAARRELQRIDDERRQAEAAQEAVAWEEARAKDTADGYRDFLSRYPDGAHADDAEARIEAIESSQGADDATERAQAEEAQVLGNPITRLLVERRLAQLGHDPGLVDGVFDRNTRRAIRRFQRDNGLPVTGYVGRQTIARLLSGSGN